MKRTISLLLSFIMVLALVPFSVVSVGAETYTDSQGVSYTLSEDNSYYFVSEFDDSVASVVIAKTINGLPVKEIGAKAFYARKNLTSVEIPNSVTTIGENAFYNCEGLTSIEIPNSVTHIGKDAFAECYNMTNVEIADSVTHIGDYAFRTCHSLVTIEVPDSVIFIGDSAFFNCPNLSEISISENAYLGREIFGECPLLPYTEYENIMYYGSKSNPYQIAYKASDKSLSDYALHPQTKQLAATFIYCENLKSMEIPNFIKSIGSSAFYGCDSLTSIKIPNSVTSIGTCAFYNCENLTSIEIPDSVTYVGTDAFYGCDSLTDIYCEAESQPADWATDYYNSYWEEWMGSWNYGCSATVHWNAKISVSVENPETGDINGNGSIDSMDYLYLKRAFFRQYVLSDISVGDINKNGSIDSMDYLYLKRAFFKQYVIE